MHRQMADMMKQMGRGKGMFARMGGMLGMAWAAAHAAMDPAALERLAKSGGLPGGLPGGGLPGLCGPGGPRLPGLGGGLPTCRA